MQYLFGTKEIQSEHDLRRGEHATGRGPTVTWFERECVSSVYLERIDTGIVGTTQFQWLLSSYLCDAHSVKLTVSPTREPAQKYSALDSKAFQNNILLWLFPLTTKPPLLTSFINDKALVSHYYTLQWQLYFRIRLRPVSPFSHPLVGDQTLWSPLASSTFLAGLNQRIRRYLLSSRLQLSSMNCAQYSCKFLPLFTPDVFVEVQVSSPYPLLW